MGLSQYENNSIIVASHYSIFNVSQLHKVLEHWIFITLEREYLLTKTTFGYETEKKEEIVTRIAQTMKA